MNTFEPFLTEPCLACWLNANSGAFIGSHGWVLYLGVLAGLLIFSGFVMLVADKFIRPGINLGLNLGINPRMSPGKSSLLKPHYKLAAGIVALGISGFAGIAWLLASSQGMDSFDQSLSAAIGRHTDPTLMRFFAIITHLGDTVTFTVICITITLALLLNGHLRLAIVTVVAIGGNSILNRTLKAIFERVRPLHEHGLTMEDGWSFPSGHTSGSVVVYGMMAYIALQLLERNIKPTKLPNRLAMPIQQAIVLMAVAVAFTVGCSRIFLQVHYASDVLAGFFSGSVWLCLCITAYAWWKARLAAQASGQGGASGRPLEHGKRHTP